MLTFVIARFKEDIEWVNQLPPDAKIYLYNKGPDIEPGVLRRDDVKLITLKNSGRESGTYLQHLMHHFNAQESEFTVFTQGDPFEHAPYFLDLIKVPHLWRDIQPLALQWLAEKKIPPAKLTEEDQRDWIEDMPVRAEHFSLTTWAPLSFFDEGAWGIGNFYRQKHLLPNGTNIAQHFFEFIGLDQLAEQATGADIGVFSYGAIFAVRNTRIADFLRFGQPHLEKMEMLARADMNYGYIYERIWLHLFGEPFITLPSLNAQQPDARRAAVQPPIQARPASMGLSNAQLRQRAFAAAAAGKLDDALSLLQTALLTDPQDYEALSDLAALALGHGDQPSAQTFAQRALEIKPSHGPATYTMAMCVLGKGDALQALNLLESLQSGPAAASLQAEAPELAPVVTQTLMQLRGLGRAKAQHMQAAAV